MPLEGPAVEAAFAPGTRALLKLELFQHTGSFKARGALVNALALDEDQRRRGICTISAGNHAIAAAFAARAVGASAKVVMKERRQSLPRRRVPPLRRRDRVRGGFSRRLPPRRGNPRAGRTHPDPSVRGSRHGIRHRHARPRVHGAGTGPRRRDRPDRRRRPGGGSRDRDPAREARLPRLRGRAVRRRHDVPELRGRRAPGDREDRHDCRQPRRARTRCRFPLRSAGPVSRRSSASRMRRWSRPCAS